MLKAIELWLAGQLFPQYDGLIRVKQLGRLVLLNYSKYCQHKGVWDDVTVTCRGLIFHGMTGQVVARPLDKFFNIGEHPSTQRENLPDLPFTAFEKVDGSFGEGYVDSQGLPYIATRGSFDSPQALRATEMFRQLPLGQLPAGYTPIFEIVYPNQQQSPDGATAFSVITYDYEGLVLLALRHRETGEELPWEEVDAVAGRLGVRLPKVYAFGSLDEAIASTETLPVTEEGYVVRFANGLRIKLKGKAYLARNSVMWGVTGTGVLDALIAGTYQQFARKLPEEIRAQADQLANEYAAQVDSLRAKVAALMTSAPTFMGDAKQVRKSLAAWVSTNVPPPLRGAFFQMIDGREPPWYKLIRDGIA